MSSGPDLSWLSDPDEPTPFFREQARMAARHDQIELEVERVIDVEAGRRYQTDVQFRTRCDAVTQGMIAVAGGRDSLLAALDRNRMREALLPSVIVYLAVDDYFCQMWQTEQGMDMRKGPDPEGTDPFVRPPGK